MNIEKKINNTKNSKWKTCSFQMNLLCVPMDTITFEFIAAFTFTIRNDAVPLLTMLRWWPLCVCVCM